MNRMMDPPTSQVMPTTPFEAACRQTLADCAQTLPTAWQDLRQDAYVQFERLGMPTRRLETWKYTDLRTIASTAYNPLPADTSLFTAYPSGGCGVWVMSLKEAWADKDMAIRLVETLRPQLTQQEDAFALLCLAMATDGLVILAPAGSCTQGVLDVHITMPLADNMAHHALVVVLVDTDAELHLRIKTKSQPGPNRLLNTLVVMGVAAHGRLHYLNHQQQQAGVNQLGMTVVQLAQHAMAHQTTIDDHGFMTRHALDAHLNGEHASMTANVLSELSHQNQAHYQTAVYHHVPNAQSMQLVKGIVDDEARLDFAGTIFVARDAQGTMATQQNKHLMLSDNAKVYTRPQLRIDADDVKCTHGASIGQLDEEALFYLISRGLAPKQARQILTDGFSADVLNQLPKGLCVIARPKHT